MINLNGTEVGILKCTGNNYRYSWWTVEGIYPVYYREGHDGFYIFDNEGDKYTGTSIQDIIDSLTKSGVTLEAVLEQPSPESVKTEGSMKVVCKLLQLTGGLWERYMKFILVNIVYTLWTTRETTAIGKTFQKSLIILRMTTLLSN